MKKKNLPSCGRPSATQNETHDCHLKKENRCSVKNLFQRVFILACLLLAYNTQAATLAVYSGTGGNSTVVSATAINVTVSALKATGFGGATPCGSGGLSGLTVPISVITYNAANPHVGYKIYPASGSVLNVSDIRAVTRESGTGPTMAVIAYRVGNGAWVAQPVAVNQNTGGSCGANSNVWYFSGLTLSGITDSIEVAVYPFDAPTNLGTFQLNSLEVYGSVAAPCSGVPVPGVVTPATVSITDSGAATLHFTGTTGPGITYQWQRSTTSPTTGFTDIPGATDTIYNTGMLFAGSSETMIYYRVGTNCIFTGTFSFSPADTVFIAPTNPACRVPGCIATGININTGYDLATNTYGNWVSQEPNWQLVEVPTNVTSKTTKSCFIIEPIIGAWGQFSSGARWISPFQDSRYTTDNRRGDHQGAFTFARCFCQCTTGTVRLKFDVMADDVADVYIDAIPLHITTGPIGTIQYILNNKISIDTTISLLAGRRCLRVKLYNENSRAMGVSVDGTITGVSSPLLTSVCCNPVGRICGIVVDDENCDGRIDIAKDPGLSGWEVKLIQNGVTIATKMTDGTGSYCFDSLQQGLYTVSETVKSGWTQDYPAGKTYTFSIHPGDAKQANFGNCHKSPCNLNLDFTDSVYNCRAKFAYHADNLPSGYKVTTVKWDFGDGSTSPDATPTHGYRNAGTYTVCLSVTIMNGTECCTERICRDVTVQACVECDPRMRINITHTPVSYTYRFEGLQDSIGTPITDWFWDFGDSTTATGPFVEHQYPSSYTSATVTLTGYANYDIKDPCCFRQVSVNVPVTDTIQSGTIHAKQQPVVLSNEKVITLDQNIPNPFTENTVINYNIPDGFKQAQLIFTTTEGKEVKRMYLEAGSNSVRVYATHLSSGIYTYTLVVDGRVIDSKRMIKN